MADRKPCSPCRDVASARCANCGTTVFSDDAPEASTIFGFRGHETRAHGCGSGKSLYDPGPSMNPAGFHEGAWKRAASSTDAKAGGNAETPCGPCGPEGAISTVSSSTSPAVPCGNAGDAAHASSCSPPSSSHAHDTGAHDATDDATTFLRHLLAACSSCSQLNSYVLVHSRICMRKLPDAGRVLKSKL